MTKAKAWTRRDELDRASGRVDTSPDFEGEPPKLRWRPAAGQSRLIVEMPSAVVDAAVKRARRRRISLATLIEKALSAEGVVVALATLAVVATGCHPAGADESRWDAMRWDSGRWGAEPETAAPCVLPARVPCRMGPSRSLVGDSAD